MKIYTLAVLLILMGCSSLKVPDSTGLLQGKLQPCPSSPNCVCSDTENSHDEHFIAPLKYKGEGREALKALKNQLSKNTSVSIIKDTPVYLHLTFRSSLFKFIDDVEFHLRDDQKIIAVRSASRTGYSDLGVNRRRIEAIRKNFSVKLAE